MPIAWAGGVQAGVTGDWWGVGMGLTVPRWSGDMVAGVYGVFRRREGPLLARMRTLRQEGLLGGRRGVQAGVEVVGDLDGGPRCGGGCFWRSHHHNLR